MSDGLICRDFIFTDNQGSYKDGSIVKDPFDDNQCLKIESAENFVKWEGGWYLYPVSDNHAN